MDTTDGPHGIAGDNAGGPDSACIRGDWELSLVLSPSWVVRVRGYFSYSAHDPYAVSLEFALCAQEPLRWVFARELLTKGLLCPTGNGDVLVRPTLERSLVRLTLNSPEGADELAIPAAALHDWLQRTYQLVPPGQEHRFLDLDTLTARLLPEPPDDESTGGGLQGEDGPGNTTPGPSDGS